MVSEENMGRRLLLMQRGGSCRVKDRDACQLLVVIEPEMQPPISGPSEALAVMDAHPALCTLTCHGPVSPLREAQSGAVMQVPLRLSRVSSEALSARSHQLISGTNAAFHRHRFNYSFHNQTTARRTMVPLKKRKSPSEKDNSDRIGWHGWIWIMCICDGFCCSGWIFF